MGRVKKFFAISALLGTPGGLARLWIVFSLLHFLAIAGIYSAAELLADQFKVSPSELVLNTLRAMGAVYSVLTWPLRVMQAADLSDSWVIAVAVLHSVSWGAVWLLLFWLLCNLTARRRLHEG